MGRGNQWLFTIYRTRSKNTIILLEQRNYHINIRDYKGWINESNTYFSWELDKAVNIINNFENNIGNEVVFHDSISMKYLLSYKYKS